MGADEPQRQQLDGLVTAIATSPHNLVSARARGELGSRHIPECEAFAGLLSGPGPVLDLGAGGGLPGLVIAILRPDLEVHLLEATAKKAAFLEETATTLGLSVQVHHGRAEAMARGPLRAAFDIVTARALAPLERLVGWAAPYLAPGGRLYAIKGERWATEVEAAGGALRRSGLEVMSDPDQDPQLGPDGADPHRPRVVMLARRS